MTLSTHAYFQRELHDKVPAISHVYAIIYPDVNVNSAAEDSVVKIRKLYPSSDLATIIWSPVIGNGPRRSHLFLFPDHPGLQEDKKIVIPITDSPKPPPLRNPLTIPVLNSAKHVAVISTGASKADAVRGCLKPDERKEPLATYTSRQGQTYQWRLHWFMDDGAAS
jgi:6-phosphogluconolactonase